ncbi:trigger factor, partial [Pelagibacteraceae bacterium]|nr:trigger factor [Pelagibacteraceae bacterium]
KEILDQIDKSHNLDLPKNLVENEMAAITQNLKKDDLIKHKNNNEKIAQSRIKIGLILNEYGEKNNLKVSEEDVKKEIQKQIKGMPGQEQMVLDYYQKNPSATQSLKGALYEDKIISLIKSKIKLENKNLSIKEAEKIISNFNKPKDEKTSTKKSKSSTITKQKKNISKK